MSMAKPRPKREWLGKSEELRGNVQKRPRRRKGVWRQKGPKAQRVNQGDLFELKPVFMQARTLTKSRDEQESERP